MPYFYGVCKKIFDDLLAGVSINYEALKKPCDAGLRDICYSPEEYFVCMTYFQHRDSV